MDGGGEGCSGEEARATAGLEESDGYPRGGLAGSGRPAKPPLWFDAAQLQGAVDIVECGEWAQHYNEGISAGSGRVRRCRSANGSA